TGRTNCAPASGLTSLTDEKAIMIGHRSKAAHNGAPAQVPPSNAAKPRTDAIETAPAVASPSPVKADSKAEKKASVKEPKPSLEDRNRPAGMERPEQPDDLKLISGVGPKIEGILHGLGIFTFAQVASWKKAEREWVDGYLNFR